MSSYSIPGSSMSTASSRGALAYRTVDAQSRSPLELVVMLYDGGVRFLGEARDAHERNDMVGRAVGVSRALAVVGELRSTLNLDEGGEMALDLDRLYDYMMSRLLDVTTKRDTSGLEEVQRLMMTVREGWIQLSASASPPQR
jgi:flagellar protein FliS